MPKRQKDVSEDEFDLEEEVVSEEEVLDDDDEEYGKKSKKSATKKKPTPKKKKDDDVEDKPKPKRAKAPPPPTEPTTLADGWTIHPPSLMYKANPAAQGGSKIAAIDMDGTLIVRKSTNPYGPKDVNDWKWYSNTVLPKVKEIHADGYQILIVSNQGGIKSALLGAMSEKVRGLASKVLGALDAAGVPAQVMMATQKDEFRKPGTGMWDFFVENLNKGVAPNKEESFFVGDAAGRPGDINEDSASDKEFAEAVGLKFHLPDDFFRGDVVQGNKALADAFAELAALLKAAGENFKANAYTKVSQAVLDFPQLITSSKDVKGVPGIGKSSQAKIDEFCTTGKMGALEDLKGGAAAQAAVANQQAAMAMKFF